MSEPGTWKPMRLGYMILAPLALMAAILLVSLMMFFGLFPTP